jgi:hypothetical protein
MSDVQTLVNKFLHDEASKFQDEARRVIAALQDDAEAIRQEQRAANAALEAKQAQLTEKLDSFYTKLIEIFGLFVAVFSFIIAGIQVAAKQAGSFWQQLAISGAVFIPLTLCIIVLLLMVRWVIRK